MSRLDRSAAEAFSYDGERDTTRDVFVMGVRGRVTSQREYRHLQSEAWFVPDAGWFVPAKCLLRVGAKWVCSQRCIAPARR